MAWRLRSPFCSLAHLVWEIPVYAVPFALFFGLLFGSGPGSFLSAYAISVTFVACVALSYYAAGRLRRPPLEGTRRPVARGRQLLRDVLRRLGPSLVGSAVAALLVHRFVVPGFLGGARAVAITVAFTLIFTALGGGIWFAVAFYDRALESARVDQELEVARRIQTSFLCCVFPDVPGLDIHAFNLPSREVSGDFYDIVQTTDGAWLVALADVAGKGIPAALLAAMLQASLRTQATLIQPLDAVMCTLNRLVRDGSPRRHFATCFLGRLEPDGRRLTYVSAGHNPPILLRAGGRRRPLDARGVGLGLLREPEYHPETLVLDPGDRLVCYTDGVVEARNAAGDQFDDGRLEELVASFPPTMPSQEAASAIISAVNRFLAGAEPHDDMTVLTVRIAPA
jgi:hypothetical protein